MCYQNSAFPPELLNPIDFRDKQARLDYEQLVNQQIGAFIRTLRRECGLTQKALGEMLGITYQQIQKYEKGKSNITISRFIEFIEILRQSKEKSF